MSIKNLILTIIIMIIWQSMIYGCISFFYWESNPRLWPWDGRFFQIFFGFVLGLIISLGFYFESKE